MTEAESSHQSDGPSLGTSNAVLVVEEILDELRTHPRTWASHPRVLDVLLRRLDAEQLPLPRHRLETWVHQGHLSPEVAERRAEPCAAGVVGLVVDLRADLGLVTRLRCTPCESWSLAPSLPFDAEQLESLLVQTLRAGHLPIEGRLPESRVFCMTEQLGHRPMGQSMHITGLLAMIAAAQPEPVAILARATALVEPSGTQPGTQLAPVAHADLKLAAFEREIGPGSLLVAHPDCTEAQAAANRFDECWWVRDFADLAVQLERQRLLAPFLQELRLETPAFERLHQRLDWLIARLAFGEAADLAERTLLCASSSDCPPRLRDSLRRQLLIACRNLGRHTEALREARILGKTLRQQGTRLSHDALALADCELAACLFLPHHFAEVLEVLAPHLERAHSDPMSLDAETRVRIYNTAARARIALGQPDWEPLLDASLALQQDVDPDNALRTQNYRIEGLLRADRLTEAQALLDHPYAERGLSRWIRAAYRAALAASRDQVWQDATLDSETETPLSPAAARYFHQCAMQTQRPLPERRTLIARARHILAQSLSHRAPTNILWLTHHALALHDAALTSSPSDWQQAQSSLRDFLDTSELSAALTYYRPHLPATPDPDLNAARGLLSHLILF